MNLNEEKTENNLKIELAYLIGYFISSISHTNEQWYLWGLPYLEICLDSLQLTSSSSSSSPSSSISSNILYDINETYYGTIGNGYLFTNHIIEDNWNYINSLDIYINKLLNNLQKYNEEEIISLFLNTISNSIKKINYDARIKIISQRILLLFSAYDQLQLPIDSDLSLQQLQEQQQSQFNSLSLTPIAKSHSSNDIFRIWKIGIAATIGGALMFCVGGLTAPQIIASIINVLGCTPTTSTLLTNMTQLLLLYGPSTLTSSLTTLGVGVSSWKMSHRIQTIEQFELEPLQPPHLEHLSESLAQIDLNNQTFSQIPTNNSNNNNGNSDTFTPNSICILISGPFKESTDERVIWGADNYTETLLKKQDYHHQQQQQNQKKEGEDKQRENLKDNEILIDENWENIDETILEKEIGWWKKIVDPNNTQQTYLLHWETKELHRLYHAQENFFLDKGFTLAAEELLKVSSSVFSAASLPITLLERVSEIDCPWLVVMDRAKQAGKLLAEFILSKIQQSSSPHIIPITLIGYSMGTRVIYHCLQHLISQSSIINIQGILENVILIGSPIGVHIQEWITFRSIIVNRFINCYRSNDWLLSLLYRYRSWDIDIAGLTPVNINSSITTSSSTISSSTTTTNLSSSSIQQHDQQQQQQNNNNNNNNGAINNVQELLYHSVENIDITDCIVSNYDYALNLEKIFQKIYSKPSTLSLSPLV